MSYTIIGGAGFIGSSIAKVLTESKNFDVTIIDNFHTGSWDNIKNLKGIKVIKADVSEITKKMLNNSEGIFHLGIPSSTPMYRENKQLIGDSINGFIHLLDITDKKIVFASSSSVYSGKLPPHHEGMILNPTDYYTEARITFERLAFLSYELHEQSTIALRLFSVYGYNEKAKQKYANMISQFIWNILENKPQTIFGDGNQTRDFTWVEDVVFAFIKAMNSNIKFDIFNIGTGLSTSFNEVIEIMKDSLGREIPVSYVENPFSNYVFHTQASTKKAEEILKFKAKMGVKEGINKLLDYYLNNPQPA